MSKFTETLTVQRGADGFLAIREHRSYQNGVLYNSVLYIQPEDADALLHALRRLQESGEDQELPLRDGRMALSAAERSVMVNLEIFRDDALPHGGYDVLDLGPEGMAALVAALGG